MKTTIVTQEEFAKIMECCGGLARWADAGETHRTITYVRDMNDRYEYERETSVGWHHTNFYEDLPQHTFTVPTFLYEAYIK